MYGRVVGRLGVSLVNAYKYRGAYCTMTIISLLAIPLELPPNAPARASGFTSFLDGLPEYLSRCTAGQSTFYSLITNPYTQVKHLKAVYLVLHRLKLMARMHFVYLHACAFSEPRTK